MAFLFCFLLIQLYIICTFTKLEKFTSLALQIPCYATYVIQRQNPISQTYSSNVTNFWLKLIIPQRSSFHSKLMRKALSKDRGNFFSWVQTYVHNMQLSAPVQTRLQCRHSMWDRVHIFGVHRKSPLSKNRYPHFLPVKENSLEPCCEPHFWMPASFPVSLGGYPYYALTIFIRILNTYLSCSCWVPHLPHLLSFHHFI